MYQIEAEIKKNTINNFVLILEKLEHLNIKNIKIIALEICDSIDKEVKKDSDLLF